MDGCWKNNNIFLNQAETFRRSYHLVKKKKKRSERKKIVEIRAFWFKVRRLLLHWIPPGDADCDSCCFCSRCRRDWARRASIHLLSGIRITRRNVVLRVMISTSRYCTGISGIWGCYCCCCCNLQPEVGGGGWDEQSDDNPDSNIELFGRANVCALILATIGKQKIWNKPPKNCHIQLHMS